METDVPWSKQFLVQNIGLAKQEAMLRLWLAMAFPDILCILSDKHSRIIDHLQIRHP